MSRTIVSISSVASRADLLEKAFASLAPQADEVNVYLNGYEAVPAFLAHPAVAQTVRSSEAGWRGPECKLWFVTPGKGAARGADDIHVMCDDDIVYPPDYVRAMRHALERRPGTAACVHGAIFKSPFRTYIGSRRVLSFQRALAVDCRVHAAGTGTRAYRIGDIPMDLDRDFPVPTRIDPTFAGLAKQRGVAIWAIARPDGWLRALPVPGPSIQKDRARDDSRESAMIQGAAPWPAF